MSLSRSQEIEIRAGCGHGVVLWNPNGSELAAIAEGPCASCAMWPMDCGTDEAERIAEERAASKRRFEFRKD